MLHRIVYRYAWLVLSITLLALATSGAAMALGAHSARDALSHRMATAHATAPRSPTVAAPGITAAGTPSARPTAVLTPAPTAVSTPAPTAVSAAAPTNAPASTLAHPTIEPTDDGEVRTARVPILMYHYISDPPRGADAVRIDLSVRPQNFEAQLAYLQQQGYTSISLEDLYHYMKDGTPLPPKPIILTFDDGYVDAYTNALPLLLKYGFKGTFFVITDRLDLNQEGYLSWDQARIMQEKGMDIEAHSRSHIDLRNQSRAELIWQIVGSREAIEAKLHKPVHFFSYPSGRYDWNAINIVYQAGYWGAVTTEPGSVHRSDAPFTRHRVRVSGRMGIDGFKELMAQYGFR